MELLETTDIKKNVVQKRRVDKKEVRISLTEKCNLNCMFCHSEGLDSSIKRDKIDEKLAMSIIRTQISPEDKKGYCDLIVDNSGSIEETRRQVEDIWRKLNDIQKARAEQ